MHTWLRNWRPNPAKRLRARPMTCRPVLEALEERCLLDGSSTGFVQTALASSVPGLAAHTDRDLLNPWGFSLGSTGLFRIAANAAGNSPLLTADGTELGKAVVLPPPLDSPTGAQSTPNGDISNPTADFVISDNGRSAPATVLFSTEDGTIIGWNPQVSRQNGVIGADLSSAGAVFKLLGMARTPQGNFLYATDFHNDQVDVFDKNFTLVNTFTDPNPHPGFAPFGVKNINGTLFVTFAKQDAVAHDDVEGAGNGFIDEFDTSGHFIKRFATGTGAGGTVTALNSPIGMAVAPAGFGQFGGDLLVGNFGDSTVSAFNLQTGQFLGQLTDPQGHVLVLNGGFKETNTKGLWGITFGNGQGGADANALFFNAGINQENDGLFGKVTVASPSSPATGHADVSAAALPNSPLATPDSSHGPSSLQSTEANPQGKGSGASHVVSVQPPAVSLESHVATLQSDGGVAVHTQTTASIVEGSVGLVTHLTPHKALDMLFSQFDPSLLG